MCMRTQVRAIKAVSCTRVCGAAVAMHQYPNGGPPRCSVKDCMGGGVPGGEKMASTSSLPHWLVSRPLERGQERCQTHPSSNSSAAFSSSDLYSCIAS